MTRFAFIIPFRPKSESIDWEEDVRLLKRTIASVLRQTYSNLKVYVIYTDEPTDKLIDERLQYVQFPFIHPAWSDMENHDELFARFKSEKKAWRRWDKARKICYGSKLAKETGCDYIMALDSDDLLSKYFLNTLVKYTPQNTSPGWFLDTGYLYKEGSSFLLKVPEHMCSLNGSTHVLRSDLVRIPDFNSLIWENYSLFTDHGWVRERMKIEYGAELEPLSKPMLLYVVHSNNMSGVYQKEFGFHLKAIAKRLLRSTALTTLLREEYFLLKN